MRCQFCRQEDRSYLWQPELESFYLPGEHIRGFIALSIGDTCKEKIEAGEILPVRYRKVQYFASLDKGMTTVSRAQVIVDTDK